MRPVLYYVHHQGVGHWRRALAVTAELDRPVILASSAQPPQPLPAHASYLQLPADAPAGGAVDANGRLHWAPVGHHGLLRRHQLLLAEAMDRQAVLAVVDVSMEVSVLLRTSGIPVIAVRLPGRRVDSAHQLGFDLADEVVMPVPQSWGLHLGLARTQAVGLVGARAQHEPAVPVIRAYLRATRSVDGLVCGAVRYLEPGRPRPGTVWTEADLLADSKPHPARPAPGPGRLVREDRHELAWTTSLALRRESFELIGGFDERFRGYGGEDTDFAYRAKLAGLGVWWTDDAEAFHQHHAPTGVPVQHLEDIVRNCALFAEIHGWYPMDGWLREFERQGLIDFDPDAGILALRPTDPAHVAVRPGSVA